MESTLLADQIRSIRTSLNRSVRMQASLANINHSTLLRWESGESRPTRYALLALLRSLHFSPEDTDTFLRTYFDEIPITPLVGSDIRTLRQKKAMTQGQLANRLAVNQSTISKWEMGTVVPTAQQQIHLHQLLSSSSDQSLLEQLASLRRKIAGYDLSQCFESYDQYWKTCSTYSVDFGEHWGKELTNRVEYLSKNSADAKRLLSWIYSSRAYSALVRGHHSAVLDLASRSIRIGNEIGFDLTTSYSFWNAARVYMTKRIITPHEQCALKRLAGFTEKKLHGLNSPFNSLVRSGYLLSVGDLESAQAALSITKGEQFLNGDEGQCGQYGAEYWRIVVDGYHKMYALQARDYEGVLARNPSEDSDQPIPSFISQTYHLAALTKVSKQSLDREYRNLISQSEKAGLRFALKTIEDHTRRISNINLAAKCLD